MPTTYPTDPLCSQLSGSVGDTTYGHNQYGPWVRDRIVPTDPATVPQTVIRNAMSALGARWATVLTTPQRKAWDRYALAVSRPGTTGRQNNPGGLPMYIRANIPRIQANHVKFPIVDVPSSEHDLGAFGPVGPAYLDLVENSLLYHFDTSDAWLTDKWSAMLCWISAIKSSAVNFYKGPYRYAGMQTQRFARPILSPQRFVYADTFTSGSRLHFRTRVTRSDGRLSADARSHADPATMPPPVCIGLRYLLPAPDRWLVTFDQPLEDERMRWQQWRLRWDNQYWSVSSATWNLHNVLLIAGAPDPGPGPNRVRYLTADPPLDPWFTLHSAETGLAVPAFDFYP